MNLGRFGVWTSYRQIGQDGVQSAAELVAELGFGTFWLGGSPQPSALRPVLEATDRLVAATGIVNVWASDPGNVAREHFELRSDFGDRFLLGVGIGHPEATSDYRHPLRAMSRFLDGLDAAQPPVPRQERCLAALGPKMLDLSRERSWGTHTYFVAVEHTRFARERLGPEALIATELACVVDPDPESARATARRYARTYLNLGNYTRNLLRFGFTADDVGGEGSDHLIDAVIPHGSAEEIAAVAQAHLDAGADHVCLQPLIDGSGAPSQSWRALAPALGL